MSNSSNLILTTYNVGPRLKPKLFNHSLNFKYRPYQSILFGICHSYSQLGRGSDYFTWFSLHMDYTIRWIDGIDLNYFFYFLQLLQLSCFSSSLFYLFSVSLSRRLLPLASLAPPPLSPLHYSSRVNCHEWHRKQLSRIDELLNATSDQCEEEEHKDFILREFKCGKITIRAERCAGDDGELPACFDVLENSLV